MNEAYQMLLKPLARGLYLVVKQSMYKNFDDIHCQSLDQALPSPSQVGTSNEPTMLASCLSNEALFCLKYKQKGKNNLVMHLKT